MNEELPTTANVIARPGRKAHSAYPAPSSLFSFGRKSHIG